MIDAPVPDEIDDDDDDAEIQAVFTEYGIKDTDQQTHVRVLAASRELFARRSERRNKEKEPAAPTKPAKWTPLGSKKTK